MRGADGGSRDAIPFRVIPARGQVAENVAHSSNKEPWHVLHEYVAGSYLANDPGELGPEPTGVVLSASFPGEADGLAGEPAADEVDGLEALVAATTCGHAQHSVRSVGVDSADVFVSTNSGPMFGEDSLAVRVDLDLPDDFEPGAFEAKVESADPTEERSDSHVTAAPASYCTPATVPIRSDVAAASRRTSVSRTDAAADRPDHPPNATWAG